MLKTNININSIDATNENNLKYKEYHSDSSDNFDIYSDYSSIDQKKEINLIFLYDFYCINNILISMKIKQLPYYITSYHVFNDYNFIKIGKMDEKRLENYKVIDNNRHVMITYNNKEFSPFDDYITNVRTPKEFIKNILDIYSKLSINLLKLNQNGICFFDLSSKNIVFDKNGTILLKDYEYSLIDEKLDDIYINDIFENLNDFTYKPLEVHVLFYLIKNNQNTLSYNNIDTICKIYMKNLSILSFFSLNYKEMFYKSSIETLKKYINKPKTEIIRDILTYHNTWDNYSLSILYIHIIGYVIKAFSLKQGFMIKFIVLLCKNINPNPLKRETFESTIEKYNKLFIDYNDWSSIKDISEEKIKLLYKFLYS